MNSRSIRAFPDATTEIMDDAVKNLELVVTSMEKRIDTLSWKIKKFELMVFSGNKMSDSCRMMSMMASLAKTCNKYDEILSRVEEHRNEQFEFSDALQIQVNLVKSKVETLKALITKGRTTE